MSSYTEEKKSGFFAAIVKAFDSFVQTFKKHGLLTVTFILVLFLLFYSFILHPVDVNKIVLQAFQEESKLKQEQIKAAIEQRLEADKLMLTLMNHLVENYHVDRALVFEMHNGSQNLSGCEFLFLSAVSEVLSNRTDSLGANGYDLDYIADSFSKQHITNIIGETTYNRLKTERYLYYSNLSQYTRSTYRLINKLKTIGHAKSVMLIPFVSDGKPLVILVLCSHNETLDAEGIYKYVDGFKSSIERNLMSI